MNHGYHAAFKRALGVWLAVAEMPICCNDPGADTEKHARRDILGSVSCRFTVCSA